MNLLRSRETWRLSPITNLATRAGVLAVLAGLGCSASGDVGTETNDATVDDRVDASTDSSVDTNDTSIDTNDTSQPPCRFVMESINNLGGGLLRTDVVGRGTQTRFYLYPTNSACDEELTRGIVPQDAHGRPAYHWPAQVCLDYQGTTLCRPAEFVYTGGFGYKGTYVVGPVEFNIFAGLPANFVAQNQPVTLRIPFEGVVNTHLDFDWVPPVAGLDAIATRDRELIVSFSASEPGHWSVVINDQYGNNTTPGTGVCGLYSGMGGLCEGRNTCIYNGGNTGVCVPEVRGGTVFYNGIFSVTIPFSAPRGNYSAHLEFVDLNGIPAEDRGGNVSFSY